MKKCSKCQEQKELSEFNKNKGNKDGLHHQCKKCKREIDVQYRNKKRQHNSENNIDYSGVMICCLCKEEKPKSEFNKNKSTSTGLTYECKKCQSKRSSIYYKENREDSLVKMKVNYLLKRDYKLKKAKEYVEKNRDKVNDYQKKYQKENRVFINKNKREYTTKRKSEDPLYKFKINTRSMIYCSFKRYNSKNYVKSQKTEEILGCSMDFFAEYISSLFQEGMSLSNHGEWHLDHIIPLASANTEEEIIKLNHYTNIQPLWAADNMSKGKKIL